MHERKTLTHTAKDENKVTKTKTRNIKKYKSQESRLKYKCCKGMIIDIKDKCFKT